MTRSNSFSLVILTSPLNLAGIISGLVLAISVLLPWLVPSAKLGTQFPSANAGIVSIPLLVMGIVGGITAIGTAVLPFRNTKSYVHIAIGVAMVFVLLLMLFNRTLPLFSSLVRSYIKVGIGIYLFAIAGLLLISVGVIERLRALQKIKAQAAVQPIVDIREQDLPKTKSRESSLSSNLSDGAAIPQPRKKVSGAWWLLPILLGLLGGIIAFTVVLKRRRGRAFAMLIVGACQSATIVVVIWNILSRLANLGF